MNHYCRYFQAYVKPEYCWFVVAILKAEEHVVFARTFDIPKSILEFFVPEMMVDHFLAVMDSLVNLQYVQDIIELENRYKQVP